MGTWQERLDQERLLAFKKAGEQHAKEQEVYDRLKKYLDKFQAQRHLQDIKEQVWKCGSMSQLQGREKGKGWDNTWSGIEWLAFQLHFDYRDIDRLIGISGSDFLGPRYRSYDGIDTRNYDVTVGAAHVPHAINYLSQSKLEQGDYLYVIYPYDSKDMKIGSVSRKWTMGEDNHGKGISLSKPENEVLEYLEGGLLKAVSLPLPADVAAKAASNIKLFINRI